MGKYLKAFDVAYQSLNLTCSLWGIRVGTGCPMPDLGKLISRDLKVLIM